MMQLGRSKQERAEMMKRYTEEVITKSKIPTDINDHLLTLFLKAINHKSEFIVELGVRTGESTFALERAAQIAGARMLSVDINPTPYNTDYGGWEFWMEDDIELGKRFPEFCRERNIHQKIDFLFIDTAHTYDQTRDELETWIPHLAKDGIVLFHDTNLRPYYYRKDGSGGIGWDNDRGVIRAIESFLQLKTKNLDESKPIQHDAIGWRFTHIPHCCGLGMLRRL